MSEFSSPEGYEHWMGRWSARLAPAFLSFANLPKGGQFLDVGSGTGVLAATLLARVDDATAVGVEPAESYVAYSQARLQDERLRFLKGGAMDIPFEDERFDGTLSLLILQELPDAPKAVREMCRVTRAGGCVTAGQWNFENGMPMLALFWETVVETIATDAARKAAAECMIVDYPDKDALRQLWESAGLVEVTTDSLDVAMEFANFDDYWMPFLSGVTPSSSYAGGLSEDERETLKASLRQKLIGQETHRPFTLFAQAWAVRGRVPHPCLHVRASRDECDV